MVLSVSEGLVTWKFILKLTISPLLVYRGVCQNGERAAGNILAVIRKARLN